MSARGDVKVAERVGAALARVVLLAGLLALNLVLATRGTRADGYDDGCYAVDDNHTCYCDEAPWSNCTYDSD